MHFFFPSEVIHFLLFRKYVHNCFCCCVSFLCMHYSFSPSSSTPRNHSQLTISVSDVRPPHQISQANQTQANPSPSSSSHSSSLFASWPSMLDLQGSRGKQESRHRQTLTLTPSLRPQTRCQLIAFIPYHAQSGRNLRDNNIHMWLYGSPFREEKSRQWVVAPRRVGQSAICTLTQGLMLSVTPVFLTTS